MVAFAEEVLGPAVVGTLLVAAAAYRVQGTMTKVLRVTSVEWERHMLVLSGVHGTERAVQILLVTLVALADLPAGQQGVAARVPDLRVRASGCISTPDLGIFRVQSHLMRTDLGVDRPWCGTSGVVVVDVRLCRIFWLLFCLPFRCHDVLRHVLRWS